jgi:hypothetical protein
MSVPFCSVHTINVSAHVLAGGSLMDDTRAYPAVSGNHRPWRCAFEGVRGSGRLRIGLQSSLPRSVVAQISL